MPYSEETKRAIQIAQSLSREYNNEYLGCPHLMMGLLHNDVGLASWLASLQKDINFIKEWAEIRLEQYPKSNKPVESPAADKLAANVFDLADMIALQLNRD